MAGKYYDFSLDELQKKYPTQLKKIDKSAVEEWFYSEMGSPSGNNKPGLDYRQKMNKKGYYFTEDTNGCGIDKTKGK